MKKFAQITACNKITLFDTEDILSMTIEETVPPREFYLYVVSKTGGINTFKYVNKEDAVKQYDAIKHILTTTSTE